MKIKRLGYYDPRTHNFVTTGWYIRILKWAWEL